jgi:hypothetical protein
MSKIYRPNICPEPDERSAEISRYGVNETIIGRKTATVRVQFSVY